MAMTLGEAYKKGIIKNSSSGNGGSHSVGVRPAILMSTDNKIDEKDIMKVFKID